MAGAYTLGTRMDILHQILDLIAPRRPTARLVVTVTDKEINALVVPRVISDTTCLLPYHHELVQALITENKFYGSVKARTILGNVLRDWLEVTLTEELIWIVPIPLSPSREHSRGYNQVTTVVGVVCEHLPNYSITPLLSRTRDTLPQTTLGRTKRLHNMSDAFSVSAALYQTCQRAPGSVIIVDDVLTTGATMAAARAALAPHLPATTTLHCLALAH